MNYKQTGDIGDLIYSLPIIRYKGKGNLCLNCRNIGRKIDGSRSGFTEELVNILKPLLEAQDYIESANIWRNEKIDVDIDNWRRVRFTGTICHTALKYFNIPAEEANKPWITVSPKKIAKTVFSRSPRYTQEHSPAFLKNIWEERKNDAIFIGLPLEHKTFCTLIGNLPYHPVSNFLEIAEVIAGSELFIGNQNGITSIAHAMHHNIIMEIWLRDPNCIFDRPNAKYFPEYRR